MITINGIEYDPGFYAESWRVRWELAELALNILKDSKLASELENVPSDDYSAEYDTIDKLTDITNGGYWTIDQGLYLVEYGSDLDKAMQAGG